MDQAIVSAFHATSRLTRSQIFARNTLMPAVAVDDANTPAPGWIGDGWRKGTVLIGINPGGGGDFYRRNPTDDQLYGLLRAFRDSEGNDRAPVFSRLSDVWRSVQKTHNIWRVISAVLEATGENEREIGFMNVVPFRTRMDKIPSRAELTAAWHLAAKPQLEALNPKRIICLGKKAWDAISRYADFDNKLVLIKRAIGDSYLPVEAQATLEELAKGRHL